MGTATHMAWIVDIFLGNNTSKDIVSIPPNCEAGLPAGYIICSIHLAVKIVVLLSELLFRSAEVSIEIPRNGFHQINRRLVSAVRSFVNCVR